MEEILQFLQQEQPKIADAAKNVISFLVGVGTTASQTDLDMGKILITMEDAVVCAKVLLKCIQEVIKQLPDDSAEYFAMHPQGEEQSGSDRLDQIIRYKTIILLRNRVQSANLSVNKFFGKSLLLWTNTWAAISSLALASKPSTLSARVMEEFLNAFGQGLGSVIMDYSASAVVSGASVGRTEEGNDQAVGNLAGTTSVFTWSASETLLRDVIWASDFKATLSKVREQRLAMKTAREQEQQQIQNQCEGGDEP